MNGRRVLPDAEGWAELTQPGDYGHHVNQPGEDKWIDHWQMICPDGSTGSIGPGKHTVTEHEDGTVTVHPSIVSSTWHGWLRAGIWSPA